ncbi:MAG TPA: 4Fe-4S binding protein, partial [Thermoguttaceae bacterium]|nr:4Fe-4S binding protein [Thermoguttaceae bacterium]
MTRPIYILPALLLLSVFAEAARAELRQPIPEFVEHVPPTSQHPQPLPDWREYLDVAALLVALSLASLFALKTRSRRGLFLLAVASLVWFGFWRKGCVCAIGSIQNVALAIGDPTYQIPLAAVVFFALPLVFTLFFGRTFCAAVCPLGAVQEVVAVRPVKVPAWLEHTLGLLAYVYLGAAVVFAATGTAFVICRYDLFVGFFRLGAGVNMLILGGCFLVIGLFVGRPYCRFLCPYGAILGLLSKVSKRRVEIPPEECVRCKLCEEVCPYGAIREPTVDQPAGRRRRGRWRLAGLIVLLPLLAASGGWLGSRLDLPFARMHPTFRLAERVRLENEMKKELDSR